MTDHITMECNGLDVVNPMIPPSTVTICIASDQGKISVVLSQTLSPVLRTWDSTLKDHFAAATRLPLYQRWWGYPVFESTKHRGLLQNDWQDLLMNHQRRCGWCQREMDHHDLTPSTFGACPPFIALKISRDSFDNLECLTDSVRSEAISPGPTIAALTSSAVLLLSLNPILPAHQTFRCRDSTLPTSLLA